MAIIKKFRIKNFKQEKELLRLDKISVYFGKRKILEDLSLNLNQGEILGLLGPNGVGKSTIFNIIIGLLKPNYGSVFIEKKNVTKDPIFYRTKNYKIGYVPQHGGYFHDLTLRENFQAISEIVIENKKLRDEKINLLISKFELEPLQNIKAEFLSGGQKKRLVISLALLSNPKILLLDEIAGGLTESECQLLIQTIFAIKDTGISIIWIEHIVHALMSVVDRLTVINFGAKIADGPPKEIMNSKDVKEIYIGIEADA